MPWLFNCIHFYIFFHALASPSILFCCSNIPCLMPISYPLPQACPQTLSQRPLLISTVSSNPAQQIYHIMPDLPQVRPGDIVHQVLEVLVMAEISSIGHPGYEILHSQFGDLEQPEFVQVAVHLLVRQQQVVDIGERRQSGVAGLGVLGGVGGEDRLRGGLEVGDPVDGAGFGVDVTRVILLVGLTGSRGWFGGEVESHFGFVEGGEADALFLLQGVPIRLPQDFM